MSFSSEQFDCLDHLNPALRDFYASGNNLPSREPSRTEKYPKNGFQSRDFYASRNNRVVGGSANRTESPVFGEEKFKELLNDPLYSEFDRDDYYPDECNYLSQQGNMYEEPPAEDIDEELVRQQLLLLSTRADEELMQSIYGFSAGKSIETESRRFDRLRTPVERFEPCSGGVDKKISNVRFEQSIIQEHLEGFGEKREAVQEDQNRKRRLCRHFLKGHCKRGKACDFLHDSSIFCPDLQKVFLGGLPAHITEASLREKLAEHGFSVINRPKVLRGFTPQVCLGSVAEAQRLIEKGKINIDGSLVDVRPYEAFAKDNLEKKLPDDIKRSVFLGGLVTGTTGQRIKDDLEKMDVRVVNHPIIKTGFSPMVTVGTVEQAQLLVKLKKVLINDALVDVRPYVDFRKRY